MTSTMFSRIFLYILFWVFSWVFLGFFVFFSGFRPRLSVVDPKPVPIKNLFVGTEVFSEMPENRVSPNSVSYNATMSAVESAHQWKAALDMFHQISRDQVLPDTWLGCQ